MYWDVVMAYELGGLGGKSESCLSSLRKPANFSQSIFMGIDDVQLHLFLPVSNNGVSDM